jgi:hypothetical protein
MLVCVIRLVVCLLSMIKAMFINALDLMPFVAVFVIH